jgi:predicted dehydrogenase
VPLTVGHIERFNPAVIELKRRLDAGSLGRVFQLHARRVGPFPERVRDVGVVLDLAPHDIDVMRFLLGSEIARVHAETEQRIATEHEDMLIGTLRFADGVVGVLDVNWLTPTKIRELSVLGERGMFVVDYLARELRFYENDAAPAGQGEDWAARHLKGVSEGPVHVLKVEKREPLRVELEAFVACVRDGTAPAVSADDALAAISASEALVRSARIGTAVELPLAVG